MLEKRFLNLLLNYKNQIKNISFNDKIIDKLRYINDCIDHLEHEINDLTIETDENIVNIYEDLQNKFGPLILTYLIFSQPR